MVLLVRTASFASIAAGTHLYQVHALSSPSAKPLHIGDLYSTSEFVPSWFGDTNLFFEHARVRAVRVRVEHSPPRID